MTASDNDLLSKKQNGAVNWFGPPPKNLSYKDYTGSVEFSGEDHCLYERILLVKDIITYEGTTVDEIERSFREAVDGYVAYCQHNIPASRQINHTVDHSMSKSAKNSIERLLDV